MPTVPHKTVKPKRSGSADLRAARAHYDHANRRIAVELTNGFLFGIPLTRLPEIAEAKPAQLADVEVIGAGNILHWESLDADYSVPALLISALGRAQAGRALGRTGGRVKSDAKAAAARVNGAKGGRPQKARTTKRA